MASPPLPPPSDFRDRRKLGWNEAAPSGPLPALLPPEEELGTKSGASVASALPVDVASAVWGPCQGSLEEGSLQWGCVSVEHFLTIDQK